MKIRHWLIFSLVLNAALAIVALSDRRSATRQPHSSSITNRSIRVARPALIAAPVQSTTIEINEPFHWSQLESQDYRVYTANLRAVGCPEETVRDIIMADVRELFHRRLRELVDPVLPRFWELMSHKSEMEEMVNAKAHELDVLSDEMHSLLKELLGPGGWNPDQPRPGVVEQQLADRRQLLAFLSPDKIERCIEIEERFYAARDALVAREPPRQEFQAKMKDLEQQKAEALSGLMTAEELSEYRLRNSRFVGETLNLKGFEANGSELRAIVQWQDELARTAELKEPNVDLRIAQRGEAEKQMQDKLKDLLGQDRFMEYQRARDNRYQELLDLTARLEMPRDAANTVYETRQAVEGHVAQLQAKAGLNEEQRGELMGAIRAEAEGAIANALGPQGYEVYRKHYGGWIDELGQPPAKH